MKGLNFFQPKSIAVVGASAKPQKVGYALVKNILDGGFSGQLYPVNLQGHSVLGMPVFRRLRDIKKTIDLVIIAIPAPAVLSIVEECGQLGIRNVVVISAGFKEIGKEGEKRERELAKIADLYKINILGPNTLGFINTANKLNASFTDIMPISGAVSFISQSGALCSAALDLARKKQLGFSYFISLGNEVNFNEVEAIRVLSEDKNTRVIAGYLEEISDGQVFLEIVRRVSFKKPIILLKAGKTEAGAKAVSSHTGSLAGSYEACRALFEKSGVIEVDNLEDLLDIAFYLSHQKIPSSFRLGIVTNAGGPGVLASDYCLSHGLKLALLSPSTKKFLKKHLPVTASIANPVDLIGDADAGRYRLALKKLVQDKNVDLLLTILTPQAMTEVEKTASVIATIYKQSGKPILAAFMGGSRIVRAKKLLAEAGIPNFIFLKNAFSLLSKIKNYQKWRFFQIHRENLYTFKLPKNDWQKLERIIKLNKGFLSIEKIYPFFKAYRLPYLKSYVGHNLKELQAAALKIGYPLALRIVSRRIIHKTDVGGVILNIQSSKDLKAAFLKVNRNLLRLKIQNEVEGFEISEMTPEGMEVIIGSKKDKLGHLIMVGWGGIYTEVLHDVAFGLAPLTKSEAKGMLQRTKIFSLLQGIRTGQKYDWQLVIDCLLKISDLVRRFPQISELDINPLRLFPHGCKIIDMKMKIGSK